MPLWYHGGGTDTEKEPAHKKVNPGKENSPTAPAEIRTRNLSITSLVLLPTSYPGSHKSTCMDSQSLMPVKNQTSQRGVILLAT